MMCSAYEDYHLVRSVGIRAVRDGVRWPCVETSPNFFDWSTFVPMLRAAEENNVQVIWNLLHYGWPPDIDILSSSFVDRFARYCRAVSQLVKNETSRIPFYVPVNEISFLAWAMGHKGIIQPVMWGAREEIKRQLIRAAIAGMEAIWSVDPRAASPTSIRSSTSLPPGIGPISSNKRPCQRRAQFDAWDMIAGRTHPTLGGNAKYLDIVGVNYYHSNQWETPDIRPALGG